MIAAPESELSAVLEQGVRALYQPIVELSSGHVVGYEALARGPKGSRIESPVALFDLARREGRVVELDWACRVAAVTGALERGLRRPGSLFVNIEPEVLGQASSSAARALLERARAELNVFFEVTERALTLRPAELLDAVETMRQAGYGIALDDVGADPRSLALLPLLRPDVVKLDMSLIHGHPSRRAGEVMNGVCAYAEETGATIVAEGVEHEGHLLAARSLGASLAQGWHFGRPKPLPELQIMRHTAVTLGVPARVVHDSPAELVHARRGLSVGRKDVLLSVSRALETKAVEMGEHAVVIAAFQHVRHFTPATRARYARIGASAAFAAALGAGMPDRPAPRVRGASLNEDDALLGEWDIAVLGPHYAGALVARDLGDQGPDANRRFEFVLTFDRELVVDVSAALISRVVGSDAEVTSIAS